MSSSEKPWNNHYTREKSILAYPDENLVRMLKKFQSNSKISSNTVAIDLGCGSGRHLQLFRDIGINKVFGMDISFNALQSTQQHHEAYFIQNDNREIPCKNEIIDIITAWGSLHYNSKDDMKIMIKEIYRILKSGGYLMATFRSVIDTYLKKGKEIGNNVWITDLTDIAGSTFSFYDSSEFKNYFSIFSEFKYGYIERSILGEPDKIISHWIFEAKK